MTLKALWVGGIFLASTSIALAHDTRVAWTTAKAERIVTRDAIVRLPAQARASLEAELRAAVGLYRTLEETAATQQGSYEQPAATIHNLRYRFSTALKQVQSGLEIEAAVCTGTGAASGGNRFGHFRCAVTSAALEIPSAEVIWENDTIAAVIEDEPRIEGPFQARLDVHVMGKSKIGCLQSGTSALLRMSRP